MQNYIDKNYSSIKKITPNISDDLADKIIKFVNQSRLTKIGKKKDFIKLIQAGCGVGIKILIIIQPMYQLM